jgi:regulator of replication initiation timing
MDNNSQKVKLFDKVDNIDSTIQLIKEDIDDYKDYSLSVIT